jgi:Na+/glutamate symporter
LILQYYHNGFSDFKQALQINKIKSSQSSSCNMVLEIFLMWGCVDLKDCFSAGDLSNIASTYIGIIIGAVIGGFISWLIYNRQEKTAVIQKEIQDHILHLEEKHEISLEKHEAILQKIQTVEQNHEEMLKNIFTLDKKINSFLENK